MIDINKTTENITKTIRNFMAAEEYSYGNGYLQKATAEVKILGTLLLIFLAISSRNFAFPLILFIFAVFLALASRISPMAYISRIYIMPLFSVIIVLPLAFAGGDGIYGISVSKEGMEYVALFALRVMASVACISLLLFTTRFSSILSALRRMHVPPTLINVMAIVYRYLFTFLTQLNDMLMGRRSRMIEMKRSLRGASNFAGNFMSRILFKSDAVHMAMRARGFDGGMKAFSKKFEWNLPTISYSIMVVAMVLLWILIEL